MGSHHLSHFTRLRACKFVSIIHNDYQITKMFSALKELSPRIFNSISLLISLMKYQFELLYLFFSHSMNFIPDSQVYKKLRE